MTVIRSQCKDNEEYRISLRDDFAAAALQGIMADPEVGLRSQRHYDDIVNQSYRLADAMLTERDK